MISPALLGQTFFLKDLTRNKYSRFQLIQPLGLGNNQVFLAQISNKLIAVKIHACTDSFESESRLSNLKHPNLAVPFFSGHCFQIADPHYNLTDVNLRITYSQYCSNKTLSDFYKKQSNAFRDVNIIRTWFHQIVSALEFLHNNNVAHGDVKAENLLVSKRFQIKLSDFDLCYKEGDYLLSCGTKNYRGLEVLYTDDFDVFKADIFALGIVLFYMMTRSLPFNEDEPNKLKNFYQNPGRFWEEFFDRHTGECDMISDEFIRLFEGMVRENPEERFSISDIRQNNWFQMEVYDKKTLELKLRAGYSD